MDEMFLLLFKIIKSIIKCHLVKSFFKFFIKNNLGVVWVGTWGVGAPTLVTSRISYFLPAFQVASHQEIGLTICLGFWGWKSPSRYYKER
jgi:hypothetical protein